MDVLKDIFDQAADSRDIFDDASDIYLTQQPGAISTVTGQPVPSAEEKISRGNEMIRTAGPIIGDIALSAVMPQKRIAEGAGLAAKLGIKGLNLLMRSGAAGVGGAVGDIAAQKITSDQPVDMGSAGKQAALGAAGEVVGSGVVSGVKGAGFLADKASNVMPGINRMTKMATSVTNKARKKFQEKTTAKTLNFIEDMGTGVGTEKTALAVGDVLTSKKDYKTIYAEYNKLIDAAAGKEDEILLEDFTQRIQDLIEDNMAWRGDKNWMKSLSEVKKRLNLDKKAENILNEAMAQNGYMNKDDAKYFLATVWKKQKDDPMPVKKIKEELKELFLSDLGNGSGTGMAAKDAKEQADKIFAASKRWFEENPTAETITQKMRIGKGKYYEAFPDRSYQRLVKATPDEMVRIKKEILSIPGGEEAWAGFEFNFVKDIYEGALAPVGNAGRQQVKPLMISDAIYKKEEYIKKVFPEKWPKLKAEADYYREASKQFELLESGDIFGVMSAWEHMSPKSKKLALKLAKGAGTAGKVSIKSLSHMVGENGQTE